MQVSQSQAIEGTPVDVPVPRKVSFIFVSNQIKLIFHLSFLIFHFGSRVVSPNFSLIFSTVRARPKLLTLV
jgi:hypothetical protein